MAAHRDDAGHRPVTGRTVPIRRRFHRSAAVVLLLAALLAGAPQPVVAAQPAGCEPHPDVTAEPASASRSLDMAIDDFRADPRLDDALVGLSLWVDGFGEVAALHPDRRLRPASVQKILTSIAALEVLGPDRRLSTTASAGGPVVDGVLQGDLYLVGGGDPTLASRGGHSLRELASLVRLRGISSITGGVVVDESRYDSRRDADGWEWDDFPGSVGTLSALTVDGNDERGDIPFWFSPALHHGVTFGRMLAAEGITVGQRPRMGVAPSTVEKLVELRSMPVSDLVAHLLTESDNTYAELLTKEIGLVGAGRGSTGYGVAVAADTIAGLCSRPAPTQGDGSGLSDLNRRSARDWRIMLQNAQSRDWYPQLIEGLAVAGRTGTLENRFLDTAAAGNMRAKTGTIDRLRSLTGVMLTEGGRRVFFSAIVDADDPSPAMAAVDDLLVDVAADRS